uniref:B-cell lymphoma 9 beta-catenin binding domain-containing protein n=1 Tax=Clastoptera arizonana TaxID=38151 RepID=A0A1B6CK17_9HEMI
MIKEKHREKKKTNNGNVATPGNGSSSGGNSSEGTNVGIKPEPLERDRELERVEEEMKDETPNEESHGGEKSGTSSPAIDTKSSVVTNTSSTDLNLPDAKSEEGPLLDSPVVLKGLKSEDGGNTESEFHGDPCESVLPMGLSLGNTGPCPGDSLLDGVQPLASNVINKQPGTMEAQYMQQQSQIFVFSTTLANKSAESVIQGQYSSIIAYHCAQPRTKKYLEKHPLKMTQFNRQNPAQWLNNLAQIKQKVGPGAMKCLGMGRGTMKNNVMMDVGLGGIGMGQPRMPMWNHGGNGAGGAMQPQPGVMKPVNMDNSSGMLPGSPNSNSLLQSGLMNSLGDFPADPLSLGSNHSLAGVKVPDENLTPQQRQHREEQLATLRKMQQMLFPEHHSPIDNPLPPAGATPTNHSPTDLEEVMPLSADTADMILSHHKNQPGMVTQNDWQKLQLQFYEERNKKGPMTTTSGQGPPPPYHQATRSASVPIAMPSPNPSSPNNTTSNLSLPSPRTCSGLNSPAEGKPTRHQNSGPGPSPTGAHNSSISSPGPSNSSRSLVPSNPGTPVSTHLSPKKDKFNNNAVPSEFSPTSNISAPLSQHSPDGMFCRSLQSLVQQKQQSVGPTSVNKEPNLMPVPSPQQIQYLNTFEGQELTIQKQPNTSLKETNLLSPLPSTTLDGVLTTSGTDHQSKVSGPATPLTPTSVDMGVPRYPSASTPGEFTSPSPQPVQDKSQSRQIPPNNKTDQRFPCTSPQMTDTTTTSRFNMISSSPVVANNFPTKPGSHFMDVASPNKSCGVEPCKDQSGANYPCIGPDNVPLNPNGITRMTVGNGGKVSHFDPITSLAQMSQQLTNNVANSPANQPGSMLGPGAGPGMHPGMMQFNPSNSNNMHLMQINDLGLCPGTHESGPGPNMGIRMGNPQMVNHSHVFSPGPVGNGNGMGRVIPCQSNAPSISPKPNIMQGPYPSNPNTMQQRMMARAPVASSFNGANIQVKPSAPNTIQYLPTRPQSGNIGPRGPPSLDFLRFSNPLSNLETKVPTHNLQYFPNNYQQNNMGSNEMLGNVNCSGMVGQNVGINPGNMMIRGNARAGSGGMMRVGVPTMSNVGFPNNEQMFTNSSGNSGSCQMFVPGSKSSPMGLGVAPDASQPLPPSMGQSNNFKNSSFIGPITADPNYAQQFHNFQQQLYATNTKSQLNNQNMGGGQQFFAHK